MFNDEEKLTKWKDEINKKEVTEDQLELAIKQGFQRAKNMPNVKKRPYVKRGIWSAIVAAVLLITLVTSIRVSPAFANAVASIPGMEGIVAFIQDNKGLQSAIDNEHYQEIGVSDGTENVKITLEGAIADDQNMIVFFTTEFKYPAVTHIDRFEMLNANGEALEFQSMSANYEGDFDEQKAQTNSVEYHWHEPVDYDDFILRFKVKSGGEKEVIELPFSIKPMEVPSKTYALEEVVTIEDQKITINSIVINPIRTEVQVTFDANNSMKIYGFEDMRLVDENGETWSSIVNGLISTGMDEGENAMTFYLQSNYFEEPSSLSLEFGKLIALHKDETYLLLDTKKRVILEQPADHRYSVLQLQDGYFELLMKGEEGHSMSPFNYFIDAEGKEISFESVGTSMFDEEGNVEISMNFPDVPFVNPIKLPLYGHPQWIEGDVKIQIK